MKVARALNPKHLVIIGDFADCYSVSDHDKDPEHATRFAEEVADVEDGLDELDSLGATNKLYIEGNHEDRVRRYVMKHPELRNVLTIPKLFNLTQRGQCGSHIGGDAATAQRHHACAGRSGLS